MPIDLNKVDPELDADRDAEFDGNKDTELEEDKASICQTIPDKRQNQQEGQETPKTSGSLYLVAPEHGFFILANNETQSIFSWR